MCIIALTDGTVCAEVFPSLHADVGTIQSTLEMSVRRVNVRAQDVAVVTVPVAPATEPVSEGDSDVVRVFAAVRCEVGPLVCG